MKRIILMNKKKLVVIVGIFIFTIIFYRVFMKDDSLIQKDESLDVNFTKIKDKELKGYLNKPKDFNITVSSARNKNVSQMQVDFQTKQALVESQALDVMRAGGAFAGVQKTQEKYQEKVLRIDARIKVYTDQLKKDPGNRQLQDDIANLYQMRSILTSLEDVVIVRDLER